jgi:hypothetical protein
MMKKILTVATVVPALALASLAATIPAGTKITIRTDSQISSKTAKTGQAFGAMLARDLVVGGKTVAKKGAPVKGKVSHVKPSGRLHAPGELTLRLTSVDGIPVSTTAYYAKGKSHTKSNATKIGGGTAAGAAIGALAGGGKGALIGAGAGAAAGTGVAAATGKEEAVVHAESLLTFTTNRASSSVKE